MIPLPPDGAPDQTEGQPGERSIESESQTAETVSVPIIPIGTTTLWGAVKAVGAIGGERYYWMVDHDGSVAMIPSDVVHANYAPTPRPDEIPKP